MSGKASLIMDTEMYIEGRRDLKRIVPRRTQVNIVTGLWVYYMYKDTVDGRVRVCYLREAKAHQNELIRKVYETVF